MPSADIYIKRRKTKRCPRCGRRLRHGRGVLCKLHKKLAAEEKRRVYAAKRASGICVWSGCPKQAEPHRSLCKGHLTDNRVAIERKRARHDLQLQSEDARPA